MARGPYSISIRDVPPEAAMSLSPELAASALFASAATVVLAAPLARNEIAIEAICSRSRDRPLATDVMAATNASATDRVDVSTALTPAPRVTENERETDPATVSRANWPEAIALQIEEELAIAAEDASATDRMAFALDADAAAKPLLQARLIVDDVATLAISVR
jgi:hypothetical protein